jgi:hypothetical protein
VDVHRSRRRVASLVIFLFAMLAYSSTDMGESHSDSHLKHR